MATSNPGPGISSNSNEMQLRSTYDINGKLLQILGPGQTVAYDPANVAIAGGVIGVPLSVTASRSIAATDSLQTLRCNSSSTITLTLPSGMVSGFTCAIVQMGAGKITVTAGGAVILNSSGSLFSTSGQYTAIGIIQTATDEYVLSGQLGA